MERQHYYRQFVGNLLESHFQEKIDLTKAAESLLPEVQIDLFFEIPKEKLSLIPESPFPCLREANLMHIKALNDRLTCWDVLQYLGELYVKGSTNNFAKDKSIALTILSAEEVPASLFENSIHTLEETEEKWIKKIVADYPAYLFIMENIPEESEEYAIFLPFLPLRTLEKAKKVIHQIAEQIKEKPEYKYSLLCLSKLQPEFFQREFGAMQFLDTKEMAKEFFPKASETLKLEGKIEELLKVLSWTAPDVVEKYQEAIQQAKTEDDLKAIEVKIQKELTQHPKTKKKNP